MAGQIDSAHLATLNEKFFPCLSLPTFTAQFESNSPAILVPVIDESVGQGSDRREKSCTCCKTCSVRSGESGGPSESRSGQDVIPMTLISASDKRSPRLPAASSECSITR